MSINVACLCKQPLDICPKKASKHLYTCDKGDSVPSSHVKPPFSLGAANMWPLSGIFLPSHCLSFSNRGSEICRTDFIWTEPERERFFEVLQSSFCLSQILCYEADKSQILVRNASLKSPQSAFSIFKHEGDILNKGISLYTLNIEYLIKIFKHQGYFKNRHWVHIPPTIFCQH